MILMYTKASFIMTQDNYVDCRNMCVLPNGHIFAIHMDHWRKWILKLLVKAIVSAGKHLSNTNLSDLSIVGACDIFVYR